MAGRRVGYAHQPDPVWEGEAPAEPPPSGRERLRGSVALPITGLDHKVAMIGN